MGKDKKNLIVDSFLKNISIIFVTACVIVIIDNIVTVVTASLKEERKIIDIFLSKENCLCSEDNYL